MVEFRLLGALEVWADGRSVPLGSTKQRLLLAAVAVDTGPVPVDTLIDRIWDEAAPAEARKVLHTYIARVRRVLEELTAGRDITLERRSGGYQLVVDPELVDLHRFRRLVERARGIDPHDDRRAAVLREALGLWRGEALAGMPGAWAARVREGLGQQRLTATAEWADAELALGRHWVVLERLQQLVVEHPLAESLAARLIQAMVAAGRDAEALEVYAKVRQRIADELGAEPGPELRRLHEAVLRGEEVAVPRDEAAPRGGPAPVSAHRQLPPDIADFTGRRDELAAVLATARAAPSTAVPVAVVEGMAGVGKTKLAVHAAHLLVAEGRFADGQLYVDLQAFSPGGRPAHPGAVLESFLRQLGVPSGQIPDDLAGRSAVFRDRLAGRRMLVLLDNAGDTEQVAPLLPANPACAVIVTSRRSLAIEGSRAVRLEVFPDDDSIDLVRAIIGAERVDAEPEAARDLVRSCGRLPLAVAIAAHRLRSRPGWPIAHLVARLGDQSRRLGELTVGSRTVEAVFALSYQVLEPAQRRLFRLLGEHPGTDVTAESVAALTELGLDETEAILESLLDEHLLQQSIPHRYHLHDLLRAYAARLCRAEDAVDDRQAATGRLLDWYLHTVDTATRTFRRFPVPVTLDIPAPKSPLPDLADTTRALAWLDAEHSTLMAAIRLAAAGPWYGHAVQLPHLLHPYLVRRSRLNDWIEGLHLALGAARDLGDRAAEAHTFTDLGHAYSTAGRTGESLDHLQRALDLHRSGGDRSGEAITRSHTGVILRRLGRHDEAIAHYRTALDILRDLGDPAREGMVQSNLSVDLHLSGRHDEALDHARQALALTQRLGDPSGESSLRTNLGLMCARLGRHEEAMEHNRAALALFRQVGSLPGEANALAALAFSFSRVGRHQEAIGAARQALDITQRLGSDPETEAMTLNTLGEAYRLAGDLDNARRYHRRALAIATTIGDSGERTRADKGLLAAAD